MSTDSIRRKTEWDKITYCLESPCQRRESAAYLDTRDLYLIIRTLLENGFKIRFAVSDIYEKENKSNEFIRSNVDYISMDITRIILPNMYGSIKLLGTGESKINISSQIFVFEEDLLKEDGFNAEISYEELNELSIIIGSFALTIAIDKFDFYKMLKLVPNTREKLIIEENERAELYNQMSREMESFLSDFSDENLESILHYIDED